MRWTRSRSGLAASILAVALLGGGGTAIGLAATGQDHAPRPTAAQAGTLGPSDATLRGDGDGGGPVAPAAPSPGPAVPDLTPSAPVSLDIPAIGVHSHLLTLGLNRDGTVQVPPLMGEPSQAGWYRNSVSPGQDGSAVIIGHVDSYKGPAVFFRLGALGPGDEVDVALADGHVAVFTVTGVRQYAKNDFPTVTVYGDTSYPSLRLVTCGGTFDAQTRHYLSNTVVYASLTAEHPA